MKRTLVLLVLVALLVGCGGEPEPTPDAVATQIAVEKAAHATMTAEASGAMDEAPETAAVEQATATLEPPTDTPSPPTDTPVPPTDTAIPPTDTPEPVIGMSRSLPSPYAEVASAPGWDIQVVEMVRGADAWQAIKAANQFNEPAPEGMEYLLLRLHITCTYDDSEEHDVSEGDFKITGDRYVRYSSPAIVPPEPELDATMLSGGETEGWGVYLVAQGEGNLILILEEMFSFDASPTFIALEEGASVAVPSELAGIEPTDLGVARESPAPFDTMVTTEDWEVTAIDTLRGGDAWIVVLDANQFNDPPAEGMEYILVKIRARYIGTADDYESIDGYFLKSSGEKKVIYDLPSIVDPYPEFDCALYPGGVCEGWVTMQAAVDEAGLMAIFEPRFELGDENIRFLSLEQ